MIMENFTGSDWDKNFMYAKVSEFAHKMIREFSAFNYIVLDHFDEPVKMGKN